MIIFDYIFYTIVKIFVNIFFRSFFKLNILHSDVIPEKGGILLVGNHSGWFDTLFLNCAVKRPLWFATGDFILNAPFLGNIVKHLCVIPLKKNNSQEGLENIIDRVNKGGAVCVFPEGQLTRTGELQRFRHGISIIQAKTGVPIIPFYITGSFDAWSYKQQKPKFFTDIKIEFGKQFIPTGQKDSDLTNNIREKVLEIASNR